MPLHLDGKSRPGPLGSIDWKRVATGYEERIAELEKELADLKEGRTAIIPHTREHAEKLFTVANACLNGSEHVQGFRK